MTSKEQNERNVKRARCRGLLPQLLRWNFVMLRLDRSLGDVVVRMALKSLPLELNVSLPSGVPFVEESGKQRQGEGDED